MTDVTQFLAKLIDDSKISGLVWNYYYTEFEHGWTMSKTHSHNSLEINVVVDGIAYYKIGKNMIKIIKNNVLIFYAGVPHMLTVDLKEGCKILNLSLNPATINSLYNFDKVNGLRDEGYIKCQGTSMMRDNLFAVINELTHKEDNYELLAKMEIATFFVRLISLMEHEKKNESNNEYVNRAIGFIDKALTEKLTIKMIAENVHISGDYLKHIFKKYTGYTLVEYIMFKRIDLAKQLLAKKEISVSDVAMEAGIYNFQYFSTIFKKHTGMSPSEFRKQAKQKSYNNSRYGKEPGK